MLNIYQRTTFYKIVFQRYCMHIFNTSFEVYFTYPQFTHLKCTIQWFSVYSQNCATSSTIIYTRLSSPQKETLNQLAVTSQFPPNPWALATTHLLLLSPCICLFWMFHINEITQHVAFCVWLLSLTTVFSRFSLYKAE